jgi:stalled ribosome rescue protein Dom34
VPLILAAAEPIDSIYRSLNTYPGLASPGITGNPESIADAELVERARVVLDELYAAELREVSELYGRRGSQGRAAADVVDVARAATIGAVDTVLVDIDDVVAGQVDDETGAVTFADEDDAVAYGVVDEIARRVWLSGGRVLAVRRDEVPGGGPVAAILRYAP